MNNRFHCLIHILYTDKFKFGMYSLFTGKKIGAW